MRQYYKLIYYTAGALLLAMSTIALLAISQQLIRLRVFTQMRDFGIVVLFIIVITAIPKTELHERFHQWAFMRAGISPSNIQITRSFWALLGMDQDPQKKGWGVVLNQPVDGKTFRRGASASLWLAPIYGMVLAIILAFIGRDSWLELAGLGFALGICLSLMDSLYDMIQIAYSLRFPPHALFHTDSSEKRLID